MRTRGIATLAVALSLLACAQSPSPPPVDPAYRAEIEAWRGERLARLTSETGWLTLVGLHWLEPGVHRFGADPGNDIVLAGADVPAVAGTLSVSEDLGVTVTGIRGAGLAWSGDEVVEERPLNTDQDGAPDVLELGSLRMHVIARGGRLALRVKDVDSPARRDFGGIESFPIDPTFRVEARFEPFAEPRRVQIASVVGTTEETAAPGIVAFTLGGRDLRLMPLADSVDDELFFVFRDQTSGESSYGAGRFLTADPPSAGRVVLDFNRAVNPPCAFTPFATCPLPPAENILDVAISAGERAPKGH